MTKRIWPLVALLIGLVGCTAAPLAPTPPASTTPTIGPPASVSITTTGKATSVGEVLFNLLVMDASGRGVPAVTIALTTTAGTFDHTTVATGQTGTAQAILTTTADATVTATAGTLSTSARATAFPVFVPPPPSPPAPPAPIIIIAPPPPPPPPVPTLSATLTCTAGNTTTGLTTCNVTSSYNGSVIASGAVTNVAWDWADGTSTASVVPVLQHQYAFPGTFTVLATVTATTVDGAKTATAALPVVIH